MTYTKKCTYVNLLEGFITVDICKCEEVSSNNLEATGIYKMNGEGVNYGKLVKMHISFMYTVQTKLYIEENNIHAFTILGIF